jgi:hypothetical protein
MCAISSAAELLVMMRLGCYTIEVKGDVLEVSPVFSIDCEMVSLIRVHKAELIILLESQNNQ